MILSMKRIIVVFFVPVLTFASFEQNTRRYLSGPELLWSLYRVLPHSETLFVANYSLDEPCKMLSEKNTSALGVAEPTLGEAMSPHPHSGTIQWLQGCVSVYFAASPEIYAPWKEIKAFYGEEFIQALRIHPIFSKDFAGEAQWTTMNSTLMMHLYTYQWGQFSQKEKEALIGGLIFSILGPEEIIADFGFTTKQRLIKAYINRLDKTPQRPTFEAIKVISLNLILREEFLSY